MKKQKQDEQVWVVCGEGCDGLWVAEAYRDRKKACKAMLNLAQSLTTKQRSVQMDDDCYVRYTVDDEEHTLEVKGASLL